MAFSLQVSSPSISSLPDPEDEEIGEILETLCSNDDYVILLWNDFPIRLSWNYVISDIWSDILLMLRSINHDVEGFTIQWPCQAFFARWDFRLKETTLTIDAATDWTLGGGRINGGILGGTVNGDGTLRITADSRLDGVVMDANIAFSTYTGGAHCSLKI